MKYKYKIPNKKSQKGGANNTAGVINLLEQ